MFSFRRLGELDRDLIRATITHPKLYPHLSDDFSPCPQKFEPVIHDSVWHVAAYDAEEYLGLWMLHPENAICWKIHTALLPNAWGRSVAAGKALLLWVWQNTPWQRIVTDIPAYNRLAYRLASRCGFEEYGRNSRSFLKNGQLQDQILMGVSRPTDASGEGEP